ncbi:MAG: DUF3857 domain-containing protein, partial [Bacteroidales bacterium]|nr:DUF3857 domain-containing protein [Bacteroidales bacterium]
MKYLFGFLLFFLVGLTSVSGQGFFPAATIADSLRAGSEAVVRFHNTTYRRKSLDSYTETVHYAVTILNARGKHAARLFAFYDRNTEVKEISGIVFNALGLPGSKIKKKNIKDYAANPNYTLFSDHRVMTYSPAITGYPYTVEYKYTIEHKGVVGFSTWMPRRSFNISVEKACLKIETPASLGIRYMALNHDFIFTADTSGPVKRYSWSVEQMKALESGPALPHHLDYMPALFLTPLDISFEGTVGSFDNWSSYGKWVYGLIEGRDRLSEETVEKMRSLTDTIQDPHKKVRAVYQYMQGRTRYVNVALGIGGFQPLHAYEVDEKGYG